MNNRIYKRIIDYFNKLKFKLIIIYIILFLSVGFFILVGWICVLSWPNITKKYQPENISDINMEENSFLDISYSYYLDFSPSMEGFIASGKSLTRLSEVFRSINSGKSDNEFYRCTFEVENCPANIFYTSMSDSIQIRGYYNNSSNQKKDEINLANIFSAPEFKSENLNIIITDLNFYDKTNSSNTHDDRMNEFAQGLTNAAGNANISIFQIIDNYAGIGTDDFKLVNSNRNANYNVNNASYMLIVFSENDAAYEEYIRKLEQYLQEEEVFYFNKLELLNDFLQENHSLIVDDNALYDSNTVLRNFNYNNNYIKDRKDYEIGLYLVNNNGQLATFDGNIAPLDIEVFSQGDQNYNNESQINITVKTLYPYGIGKVREYSNEGPIRLTTAGITWYQGKLYLKVGIESETSIELPRSRFLNKDYFVTELQFYMEKPDFVIPQWVVELDTDETVLNIEKKRKITVLVEKILEEKEIQFAENATQYERYMGSLILYISY